MLEYHMELCDSAKVAATFLVKFCKWHHFSNANLSNVYSKYLG